MSQPSVFSNSKNIELTREGSCKLDGHPCAEECKRNEQPRLGHSFEFCFCCMQPDLAGEHMLLLMSLRQSFIEILEFTNATTSKLFFDTEWWHEIVYKPNFFISQHIFSNNFTSHLGTKA